MFTRSPSGLEQLLARPRPSLWQKFWSSPCVFIAQWLYYLTTSVASVGTVTDAVTVVCISDTHSSQVELPDGDILIHAGDLTQSGSFQELQATINWLRLQPHRHKLVVAGNHDLLLDDSYEHHSQHSQDGRKAVYLDWGDITYLQNSATTVTCANGRRLQVYGSPLSRQNGNWAFQYPRTDNVWSNVVPAETDILITHGPPRAHLDLLNLGCDHLLGELWRVRPALHVFGHVHEGYGQKWLNYDAVQKAFEKTVVARGGLVNTLTLLKKVLGWSWTPFKAPKTLLVNPAMAGGLRDEPRRRPIVVVI